MIKFICETRPYKTADEVMQDHKRIYKMISRLYAGYTPVRDIEKLYHDLEIATANELKKLQSIKS